MDCNERFLAAALRQDEEKRAKLLQDFFAGAINYPLSTYERSLLATGLERIEPGLSRSIEPKSRLLDLLGAGHPVSRRRPPASEEEAAEPWRHMTANERVKDKDAMRAAWRAEIRQREERRAAVAPAREQETEKPWWREMTASERVKDKEAMREAWRAQSRQQEERRAAAPVRIMGREP